MKRLLLVFVGAVTASAVFAVEPVWPADYDAKVAARLAEWVPSGATQDKSLKTSVDARMWSALASEDPVAMDARSRTWDFAEALIKLNTFPYLGFLLFLK